MSVDRITFVDQRSYQGSAEQIAGISPTDDQQWGADEANHVKSVVNNHAERLELYGTPKSEEIGDGVSTSFVINHDWSDSSFTVTVTKNSGTRAEVGVPVDRSVSGQITVGPFATAPLTNQFKVSIS